MPYDPNLPLENTLIDAAQMRAQLQSLNADILSRATPASVAAAANAAESNAIGASSSNSNGVETMGMAVSDPPTQGEVQTIADKLDELINALRR